MIQSHCVVKENKRRLVDITGNIVKKTKEKIIEVKGKGDDFMAYPTDVCWETGVFTDDCECEFCSHKEECSGYTGDAFEEDDE